MRRIFIIRKDLNLKPGKLAAMIGHCAEAFFTNMLKSGNVQDNEFDTLLSEDPWRPGRPATYKHPDVCKKAEEAFKTGEKYFKVKQQFPRNTVSVTVEIPKDIWNGYINDIFTKTICEAKNLEQLKSKTEEPIKELGLVEGVDYGYINDHCKTDLIPENPDGTCTVGMWFKPLPDEDAHKISKKFKLYGAFDKQGGGN